MCGITGFYGRGSQEDLAKMTKCLLHRGPESHDVFFESIDDKVNIAFGHTRLAIYDVSPLGAQPMKTENDDLVMVFNGSVYNFKTLREYLRSRGYKFKGESDTEVILYLYQEYREECFKMLDGMFALVIYEKKTGKLVLARDPFGKKPLYYSYQDGNLVFGSELKVFHNYPFIKKELNTLILPVYFANDYIPTPHTIFKNIFKLEPGTYLTLQNNQLNKVKYWDIDISNSANQATATYSEALQACELKLDAAVTKRMVADVPLGVFLSGGLDSSLVAYFAQKHAKENGLAKVKTFSIGFNESSYDESKYAKRVSEHLGTYHMNYNFTVEDVKKEVVNLADVLDEPIGDSSILPTLILSKFTKQYVTVALGGDGGDELFAGYPTFMLDRTMAFLNLVPHFIFHFLMKATLLLQSNKNRNFSLSFQGQKFMNALNEKNIYKKHLKWLGAFNEEEVNSILVQKNNATDNYDFIKQYNLPEKENSEEFDNNNILKMYAKTYMLDGVLTKLDRASMRYALETRTPFLDKALAEFAFSLPYSLKLRFYTTKFLLKKVAEGKLPHKIIYRQKKGFGIPLTKWLKGDLKFLLDDYLINRYLPSEHFNMTYVNKLKKEHLEGKYDHRKKLWNLIVFAIWYKKWILHEV